MDLEIISRGNETILKNAKDFEIKHIFDCGQCFRWNEQEDGSYTGVAYDKVINVKKQVENIIFSNVVEQDFKNIWYNYFDLGKNYGEIKTILSEDDILKEAVDFGQGIRILNQDVWEVLISFIISANNRIPMIKKAIERLSEEYGKHIGEYDGKKYYSFPRPETLRDVSVEEIKKCGAGFRAKYIANASRIVADKQMDIYKIRNLSTEEARKELMLFSGIGPKVADCIMLFSMNKGDAFPIDVWVKRVMEYFYLKKDTKLKEIQKYAQNKFGKYAGFAQQYLFYYARELGIGKG